MKLSIYMLNKTSSNFKVISKFKRSMGEEEQKIETKSLKKQDIKGYRKGLFFYQEIPKKQNWVSSVNELLFKPLESYETTFYKAVIVLQINRRYMALSFNNGISLIKNEYVDYNFGFDIAQKLLQENTISGYDTVDISDQIINVSKNSVKNIPSYLMNNHKNLSVITSVSGKNSQKKRLIGKYKLEVDFNGNLSEDLIKYLTDLSNLYYDKKKNKRINISSSLIPIKDKAIITNLETMIAIQIEKLIDKVEKKGALSRSDLKNITLNINFSENEDFEGFDISGLSYSNKKWEELNKYEYFERVCWVISNKNKSDDYVYIINKLKRDYIKILQEESRQENIYNTLIIDYELQNEEDYKAILILGKWYYISTSYYTEIIAILDTTKRHSGIINFIPYTKIHSKRIKGKLNASEETYNIALAKANDIYIFDRNNYTFPVDLSKNNFKTNSKMEPCDILKYDHSNDQLHLIHIKNHSGASSISHLCVQAQICADLISNTKAKEHFIKFINEQYPELKVPESIPNNKITIILGIMDKNYNDEFRQIFSLLEIKALSECIGNIKDKGINVILQMIPNKR